MNNIYLGYLQSKGINWLLIDFMLISIAIHAVVFYPIVNLFKEKSVSYIEFSLEEKVKPHYRSIPRPRRRHKIPQISDTKAFHVRHQKKMIVNKVPEKFNLPKEFSHSIDAPAVPDVPDMVLLGHGGWGSDPHFLKKRFADDIRQGNSLSECRSFGYHNDRLNALLNQQTIAFDHQKRKQLIAKIQVLLSEELPEIPLFNTTNYTVFRPSTYDGWCFMYDHHSLSHSKLSFLEKQL